MKITKAGAAIAVAAAIASTVGASPSMAAPKSADCTAELQNATAAMISFRVFGLRVFYDMGVSASARRRAACSQ